MTAARLLPGLTYDQYAKLPGYRWSSIKLLHTGSPLHVRHAQTTSDSGDTASRSWLRAVHCLALEPDNFGREFSVFDGRRTGKLYDAHCICNPGTTTLNPRELASAKAAATAIRQHPTIAPFLESGDPEVTITWTDGPTGLPCKARLDWLCPSGVLDLKTLGTTHERRVAAMVATHLYHGQLAHYTDGLAAVGIDVPAYLISAEGKAPQDVALYGLDPHGPDGALHVGRQLRARLMARIAECEATDHWPGRHETAQDLLLPMYALEETALDEGDTDTDTDTDQEIP